MIKAKSKLLLNFIIYNKHFWEYAHIYKKIKTERWNNFT